MITRRNLIKACGAAALSASVVSLFGCSASPQKQLVGTWRHTTSAGKVWEVRFALDGTWNAMGKDQSGKSICDSGGYFTIKDDVISLDIWPDWKFYREGDYLYKLFEKGDGKPDKTQDDKYVRITKLLA